MRKSWKVGTLAAFVVLGGIAWGQLPRSAGPVAQTVETAVTPKIVLPVAPRLTPAPAPTPRPVPLAPGVVVSTQKPQPTRLVPTSRMSWMTRLDIVPVAATQPAGQTVQHAGGVVEPKGTRSQFVSAVRPADSPLLRPTLALDPAPEEPVLPSLGGEPAPPAAASEPQPSPLSPREGATIPISPPPQAAPLPMLASPPAGPLAAPAAEKHLLHQLMAWFTYCPKGCCGKPCAPAPYIPPIYTFFLDRCQGCGVPAH
jgi:hypothetical protein